MSSKEASQDVPSETPDSGAHAAPAAAPELAAPSAVQAEAASDDRAEADPAAVQGQPPEAAASAPPDHHPTGGDSQKRRKSLLRELVETLLLTVLLFLAAKVSVQNFRVVGTSMVPTLQNGEWILVDKVSLTFHLPPRGDIIVFKFPKDTTQDFIKRVIGWPGDIIAIKPVGGVNHVFVNGKMLSEPYISAPPSAVTLPGCESLTATSCSYRVPANNLFVMGDNRNGSYDSRDWGPLPRGDVIGHALLAYWPLSRFAYLPNQFSYAKSTAGR